MSVLASYTPRSARSASGICSFIAQFIRVRVRTLAITFVILLCCWRSFGDDTNAAAATPSDLAGTNFIQLLRACSEIQTQLRAAQETIEQARREARETASRNAEAYSKGIELLQETASAQRAKDFEQMERSNNELLVVAGGFAALVVLAMLFLSFFQWRMIRGLARSYTAFPNSVGLGNGPGLEIHGSAEQVQSRLLGAIAQVDRRIHEFQRVLADGGNGRSGAQLNPGSPALPAGAKPAHANGDPRISSLLNEAQALMGSDRLDEALARLDDALALDSRHAEVLVKKGAVLERLHKLNEAVECYNQAIAADGSMALAYLHKGGLCNRLERFKEALECYGKALLLHNQPNSASSAAHGATGEETDSTRQRQPT